MKVGSSRIVVKGANLMKRRQSGSVVVCQRRRINIKRRKRDPAAQRALDGISVMRPRKLTGQY
jgi:hypothetical protein